MDEPRSQLSPGTQRACEAQEGDVGVSQLVPARQLSRVEKLQGWARRWANLGPFIGLFSQNIRPTCNFRAEVTL
jgi:hypothetical protein